jgi:hypothetical protein
LSDLETWSGNGFAAGLYRRRITGTVHGAHGLLRTPPKRRGIAGVGRRLLRIIPLAGRWNQFDHPRR